MKKILWTLALSNVMAFAVHPALQEAIDSKNYKQAENLVKNVGIKDVYCPQTLNAKDAVKIYGDEFSKSIKSLLEKCDADFSIKYLDYKCAGGKDRSACLNLVSLTDPFYWPDSYAKQFCTKKNVEFCAAAVERVSIEKSVPYLKAIKANKLADMKGNDNSIAKTVSECRRICEIGRTFKLSGQLDDEIFKKRQEWYRATTVREQQGIEQQIRRLEKEKVAVRSNDYCEKSCPGESQSKSELEKFSQYYFERAFYSLSHRVYLYYKDENNPIIPGLAENWSIVDKLVESSLDFFMKTLKELSSQDILNTDFGLMNIILERQKNLVALYPYAITKRFVMDTLKASFANGTTIGDSEQLLYCKIYPSLEKETENLFGTKVLDCKLIMEESKKLLEPCHEGDLPLKNGKFHCVEGPNGWWYKRIYQEKRVGKYIVMAEHAFDEKKQECPEGWHWPNSKEMEYIEKNVVNQPISCLKNEDERESGECSEEAEGECFEEYCCHKGKFRKGSDLELTVGKICSAAMDGELLLDGEIGYLCEKNEWKELRGKEIELGEKCNRKNKGLFSQGYVCVEEGWREQTKEEWATGKLCERDNQGEFAGMYVCDKNEWRKQTEEEAAVGKICNSRNSNEFLNGYVCRMYQESTSRRNDRDERRTGYIRTNKPKGNIWLWQRASNREMATRMVCTAGNFGKKKNGYLCDEKFGWIKDLEYGKIKDQRDGQVYKTIKIGKQEWMAENLRYKYTRTYYDGREFDGEYDYRFHSSKNVCPDGWEVPSKRDWEKLFKTVGGKEVNDEYENVKNKLLAEPVGGSNEYGFSATSFGFWTSSNSKNYYSKLYVSSGSDGRIIFLSHYIFSSPDPGIRHNIRCIKD